MNEKDVAGTWSVLSVVNEVDGKKFHLFGPIRKGSSSLPLMVISPST